MSRNRLYKSIKVNFLVYLSFVLVLQGCNSNLVNQEMKTKSDRTRKTKVTVEIEDTNPDIDQSVQANNIINSIEEVGAKKKNTACNTTVKLVGSIIGLVAALLAITVTLATLLSSSNETNNNLTEENDNLLDNVDNLQNENGLLSAENFKLNIALNASLSPTQTSIALDDFNELLSYTDAQVTLGNVKLNN